MKSKLLRALELLLGISAVITAAAFIYEIIQLYNSGYTYAHIGAAAQKCAVPVLTFLVLTAVVLIMHILIPVNSKPAHCKIHIPKPPVEITALLLIAAIVFIILGIINGGAGDVLAKAVNICTECIGLG